MNQQIFEEHLWNGDEQFILTRISAEEDGRFKIALRIDKNGIRYLDSFTCRSKRIAMRCFKLISACITYMCN